MQTQFDTARTKITGISSMATRTLLAELAAQYSESSGVAVEFESVGGVDAARRVKAGEPFDLVVLASEAITRLATAGSVISGSQTALARSRVAIAVRAGAALPDVGSEDALRLRLLAARSIGYSTGPSGTALMALFERWGIAGEVRSRIVQAPPGVPVGSLVASGEVELGFQQLAELMRLPGIALAGAMPPGCEILTTFSAAICVASVQPDAVRALLAFMRSPARGETLQRNGMEMP